MAEEKQELRIVRIMSKDVPGGMSVYSGLTRIKGVSWSFSNAICKKLKIDRKKKIGELKEDEVKKIIENIKAGNVPKHILNRRKDLDSGEDKHVTGSDLELRKDFDIKRLRKIKSYRGLRHAEGLPMRGQRTKANFRRNRRKGSGIKKKPKQ